MILAANKQPRLDQYRRNTQIKLDLDNNSNSHCKKYHSSFCSGISFSWLFLGLCLGVGESHVELLGSLHDSQSVNHKSVSDEKWIMSQLTSCWRQFFERFHHSRVCCSSEEAQDPSRWRWAVSWNRLEASVWSCGPACYQSLAFSGYPSFFFWWSNRYHAPFCENRAGKVKKNVNQTASSKRSLSLHRRKWLTLTLLNWWDWNLLGVLVIFLTIFLCFNG